MRRERRRHHDTGAHARVVAVRVLAVLAMGGYATMAYLSIRAGEMVQGFSEVITGALAALVALLAKTETEPPNIEPEPVEVVNSPESPVLTEDVTEK